MSEIHHDRAPDGIDLIEIFMAVWQERRLFFSVLVIAIVAAIAFSYTQPRIFRSEVLAYFDIGQNNPNPLGKIGALGALAGISGLVDGPGETVEVAIATVQSRQFLDRFIEEHKLKRVLFEDLWDPVDKKWKTDDPKEVPSDLDAYEIFTEEVLDVFRDPKSGLITLSVEWTDPDLAAQWANWLVAALNERLRHSKISRSEANLKFLQEELRKTNVSELRETISSLIAEEMKAVMLARHRQNFAFGIIDSAKASERPVRPSKMLYAFAGGVLGGMLGFLAALIRRRVSVS